MKFLPVFLAMGLAAAGSQKPISGQDDLSVPGANPLSFCDSPAENILTIDQVNLTPNPPQKGKDLVIRANGTLSEDVEQGSYVLLSVAWGLIKLIDTKEDLCEQLKKVDRECPLKKGPLTFEKTVTLPQQIPPGKYKVHADVYSKDAKRVTCMEAIDIQFSQNGFKVGMEL